MRWLDILFPPRTDEHTLHATDSDGLETLLDPRLAPVTRPATVVLLPFFNPVVRAAIHEAKYHGTAHSFDLLAAVLAAYLRDADDLGDTRFNLVSLVPVPLGTKRRKERGFNQVEEVARRALQKLKSDIGNITLETDLLIRTRETVSQVLLPRTTRERNMRGAFTASPRLHRTSTAEIAQRTYLIVDDVLTTGATLQAAIDALAKAGAKQIVPLALAH